MIKYTDDLPEPIRNFLVYMETIKGKSINTVDAYAYDLRTFFRFMLLYKKLTPPDTELEDIDISKIDLDFVKNIRSADIYEYLHFLSRQRDNNVRTRARKLATLKSFFKYLSTRAGIMETNPAKDIDSPKIGKTLPKHLSLNESIQLLDSVSGENAERDYAILTIFLNCGLRVSELSGINLKNISTENETLRVVGKGDKERIVYLNQSCISAIKQYLPVRISENREIKEPDALFLNLLGKRLGIRGIQMIVTNQLNLSGLSGKGYTAHKLRHTAATLMYQYGNVDIRALQEILGHAQLSTTQIYTHISDKQLKDAAAANPLAKLGKKVSSKTDNHNNK
jgi:site-specific recombinase XerD